MSVSFYDADVGAPNNGFDDLLLGMIDSLDPIVEEVAKALTDQGREHFFSDLKASLERSLQEHSSEPVRVTIESWSRAAAIMSTKRGQLAVEHALSDEVEAAEGVPLDELLKR